MKTKTAVYICLSLAIAIVASCGRKKHDAQYYELMVDSIRKAEQVKELQRQAGMNDNSGSNDLLLDTLQMRSLPMQSTGDIDRLTRTLVKMPSYANLMFGFEHSDTLSAVALPSHNHHKVFLVSLSNGDAKPSIFLFTMNKGNKPNDMLCVYEYREMERKNDSGHSFSEFFITNSYEITLLEYFTPNGSSGTELFQTRKYYISEEGKFLEMSIVGD